MRQARFATQRAVRLDERQQVLTVLESADVQNEGAFRRMFSFAVFNLHTGVDDGNLVKIEAEGACQFIAGELRDSDETTCAHGPARKNAFVRELRRREELGTSVEGKVVQRVDDGD